MDIKDIQQRIKEERNIRYEHISTLADMMVSKICSYVKEADTFFPFDLERICFIISNITEELDDLTVSALSLYEDEYTDCFTSFKDFRENLENSNSDSLYHLGFTANEWGMLFKELEMKGVYPMFYTEKTYIPGTVLLNEQWRDETKVCILADTPF